MNYVGVCCSVCQKEMRAAEKGFWDEGDSGALNKPWVLKVLSVGPSTLWVHVQFSKRHLSSWSYSELVHLSSGWFRSSLASYFLFV